MEELEKRNAEEIACNPDGVLRLGSALDVCELWNFQLSTFWTSLGFEPRGQHTAGL